MVKKQASGEPALSAPQRKQLALARAEETRDVMEDALVSFGRWMLVEVFNDDAGAALDERGDNPVWLELRRRAGGPTLRLSERMLCVALHVAARRTHAHGGKACDLWPYRPGCRRTSQASAPADDLPPTSRDRVASRRPATSPPCASRGQAPRPALAPNERSVRRSFGRSIRAVPEHTSVRARAAADA